MRAVVTAVGKSSEGRAADAWAMKQYLQKKQWQVTFWVSPLNINRIFRLRIVWVVIETGRFLCVLPLPPKPSSFLGKILLLSQLEISGNVSVLIRLTKNILKPRMNCREGLRELTAVIA